jgi:hypothetical protein
MWWISHHDKGRSKLRVLIENRRGPTIFIRGTFPFVSGVIEKLPYAFSFGVFRLSNVRQNDVDFERKRYHERLSMDISSLMLRNQRFLAC